MEQVLSLSWVDLIGVVYLMLSLVAGILFGVMYLILSWYPGINYDNQGKAYVTEVTFRDRVIMVLIALAFLLVMPFMFWLIIILLVIGVTKDSQN